MTYGAHRVFIGGISGSVTREQIEVEFGKYGKLNKVWVAQNPPGFAFVEYNDNRDADEAIKSLNGTRLFSTNEIRVEHSRSRQDHQGGSGAGGPDRRNRARTRITTNSSHNGFGNFDNNGGHGSNYRHMNNNSGSFRNERHNSGAGGPFRNNRGIGQGSRYNSQEGSSFSRYESDGGIGRFNPLASDRPQRGRFQNSSGNLNSGGTPNYQRGRFQNPRERTHSNNGGHFQNQYGGNQANFRSRSPIDNFR